jgi:hypothetical protein
MAWFSLRAPLVLRSSRRCLSWDGSPQAEAHGTCDSRRASHVVSRGDHASVLAMVTVAVCALGSLVPSILVLVALGARQPPGAAIELTGRSLGVPDLR